LKTAKTASPAPPPAASQGNVQADCRPGARNLTCSADRDCEHLTQACRAIAGALAALPFGAGSIPLDVTAGCVDGACEMRH
jgi:hypothetical protein